MIATADPVVDGLDRLVGYLHDRVDGWSGRPVVRRLPGGQSNPTWRLDCGQTTFALRAKPAPAQQLLPSAHQIEREFRVLSALQGSDVPVPRVHHLCTDESIIGRAFYVMDFVPGRTFVDPRLPALSATDRGHVFQEMNRTMAALHAVDWPSLGLGDYGRPGDYLARQVARWTRQYQASETERLEAMDRLVAWLPSALPKEDETTLVHGDFRLDNLVFDPDRWRIAAVLDWELSTLGSPLADFAYHCCVWHFPAGLFRGLAGEPVPAGVPSESEYRARYVALTGRDPGEYWTLYLVYNFFRMAAIMQGIRKRALDGIAAAADAADFGAGARQLAEMGWALAGRP